MGDYDNVNPADIRYDGPVDDKNESADLSEEKVDDVQEVNEWHDAVLEEAGPTDEDDASAGTGQSNGYENLAPGSTVVAPPNPR